MTIIYRDEKGANLTPAEVDGNFHDLDDRVTNIEDSPPEARGIADITQSIDGGALTFEMTDSSIEGPFSLPAFALRFRGTWETSTNYVVNDIITAGGAAYLVLITHTSDPTSFDPGANNGNGGDFYGLLLAPPEAVLPIGGGTGYVLTKTTDEDFDVQWENRGLPTGGNIGDILFKTGIDNFDVEWVDPGFVGVKPVLEVSTPELDINTLTYANLYLRCTHASGCDVTIPVNSSVAFEIGTEIEFRQCALGAPVRIIAGILQDSDGFIDELVTLNGIDGYDNETDRVGAVMCVKKVGTNSWDVYGLLSVELESGVSA
jgi:hypothetical protein